MKTVESIRWSQTVRYAGINPRVCESLRVPPPVDHVEWIRENLWIPDGKETSGAVDLDLFPHVTELLDAGGLVS